MKPHHKIFRIVLSGTILLFIFGIILCFLPNRLIQYLFSFKFDFLLYSLRILTCVSIILGIYFYLKRKENDYTSQILSCQERYFQLVGKLNKGVPNVDVLYQYATLANEQLNLIQKSAFPSDLKKEWIGTLLYYFPFIIVTKEGEHKNMNPHLVAQYMVQHQVLLNYPLIKKIFYSEDKSKSIFSISSFSKIYDPLVEKGKSNHQNMVEVLIKKLDELAV